jgi:D-alanyl-D-alanine carboxypeptidase/D-alanyl-D-alanine-endopeptidase (penicillin-binding protein 4)
VLVAPHTAVLLRPVVSRLTRGALGIGAHAVLALFLLFVVAPAPAAAAPAQQRASRDATSTKSAKRPAAKKGASKKKPKKGRARAIRTIGSAVPHWTTPIGADALAADLQQLITKFGPRSGDYGVLVMSLTRGDTLFASHATQPLLPASTMKLFTSILALERLGPEWQFRTDVLRDGPMGADGVVHGNLYVRGDGDPSLSSRLLGGPPAIGAVLLAAKIAATGVKRVTGDIVGDASAFDGRRIPEGWRSRYLMAAYAARVSALSLNENLVWIGVRPAGGSAEVFLEPSSSTLRVNNTVKLVNGRGARISIYRALDGSIAVRGSIGRNAGTRRYEMVVDDPALFTTGAVHAALTDAAVRVDGVARVGRVPAAAAPVTGLTSPSLAAIIAAMNGESINHYAELLFRASARGRERMGVGSAEAGNAVLQTFLSERVGVRAGQVYAADGSGLSILDRASVTALVQLLIYAHKQPWSVPFHESLPVAGVRETLRFRMRGTPAQGNLHAKTGTTNDVTSLAGFVTAQNGEPLVFAAVYNGNDRWRAKALTDAVGATLASFRRDP